MRQRILRTTPAGPQRSQRGNRQSLSIYDRELARRAPQYDLSKDERERPLCEARNRLVESPDIPVGTRKHHTALECSHYVKCSRFRFGATDPLC